MLNSYEILKKSRRIHLKLHPPSQRRTIPSWTVVGAVEKLNAIMRDVLEANAEMTQSIKDAYRQVNELVAVVK